MALMTEPYVIMPGYNPQTFRLRNKSWSIEDLENKLAVGDRLGTNLFANSDGGNGDGNGPGFEFIMPSSGGYSFNLVTKDSRGDMTCALTKQKPLWNWNNVLNNKNNFRNWARTEFNRNVERKDELPDGSNANGIIELIFGMEGITATAANGQPLEDIVFTFNNSFSSPLGESSYSNPNNPATNQNVNSYFEPVKIPSGYNARRVATAGRVLPILSGTWSDANNGFMSYYNRDPARSGFNVSVVLTGGGVGTNDIYPITYHVDKFYLIPTYRIMEQNFPGSSDDFMRYDPYGWFPTLEEAVEHGYTGGGLAVSDVTVEPLTGRNKGKQYYFDVPEVDGEKIVEVSSLTKRLFELDGGEKGRVGTSYLGFGLEMPSFLSASYRWVEADTWKWIVNAVEQYGENLNYYNKVDNPDNREIFPLITMAEHEWSGGQTVHKEVYKNFPMEIAICYRNGSGVPSDVWQRRINWQAPNMSDSIEGVDAKYYCVFTFPMHTQVESGYTQVGASTHIFRFSASYLCVPDKPVWLRWLRPNGGYDYQMFEITTEGERRAGTSYFDREVLDSTDPGHNRFIYDYSLEKTLTVGTNLAEEWEYKKLLGLQRSVFVQWYNEAAAEFDEDGNLTQYGNWVTVTASNQTNTRRLDNYYATVELTINIPQLLQV